jgi:serine/threonine protein kinase/Tol biopolymer transport system component
LALTPGTHLGVYEITAQIGAGGMGEVYRATDTNLKRSVAIKVLPASVAGDADRLARFQREAEVLAALNHPNIAAIYGLERSGDVTALVMELVEGEDLSQRISRAPIPLDEAMPIAKQIAEALEAAHEQGIIHRDLKPANIKVRPDGTVKVLDFGLAKAMEPTAGSSPSVTQSPTITPRAMTQAGMILGTAAYMSPEQARGGAVDRRTDIWAFGVVLWEMLTGKHLFKGATVSDTLAAVLTTEPEWSLLGRSIPPSLHRVLRRCLTKERKRRLADAADLCLEIDDALAMPPSEPWPAMTVTSSGESRRRALLWTMAVVVTMLAGIASWTLKPAPPQHVSRLTITLPVGDRLAGLDLPVVALSPDGSRLVYVATRALGVQQLYLRAMDNLDARPIPGTDGATTPFFSPDGLWVGFFAGGKLKKVSLSGGAALTLGDAVNPRGASWSALGTIAFGPTNASGLLVVPGDGGASHLLKHGESRDRSQRWPEFLPDGGALLFAVGPQVVAHALNTGEQRTLIPEGSAPQYAHSGHLVYAQGGTLMAVPFDPKRLTVTGAGIPVVEGVVQSPSTGSAQYSLSNTGSLAYVRGGVQTAPLRLVWVTRQGVEQPVAAPPRAYTRPQLAPDGRRIAVGLDSQVWLYNLVTNQLARLTFTGESNVFPLWTPDGKRIVFDSNKEGAANLFWQLADGSGGRERLATSPYTQAAQSWSADGQQLAYTEVNDVSGFDIWVLHLRNRKAEPFLSTPSTEAAPKFSPDGRWLAYQSNESGHDEVYVQPYPANGGKWQVSTNGGTEPTWNPNGRELFYRVGDRMMAVDVTTEPSFLAGTHQVLFEGHYAPSRYPFTNYDVSADGQRFLMLKPSDEEAVVTEIIVVQNWFEELKAKVPIMKN